MTTGQQPIGNPYRFLSHFFCTPGATFVRTQWSFVGKALSATRGFAPGGLGTRQGSVFELRIFPRKCSKFTKHLGPLLGVLQMGLKRWESKQIGGYLRKIIAFILRLLDFLGALRTLWKRARQAEKGRALSRLQKAQKNSRTSFCRVCAWTIEMPADNDVECFRLL